MIYLLSAVLLLFWGSFAAVSKLTLQNMDSYQTNFYMFGFAVLAMSVILFVRGDFARLRTLPAKELIKLILIAIPQFLYYFLYTLSLGIIPAFEASMLNYLFPLFIVLLAVPVNKEKLNFVKILSLLTGFAGVFLIITGGRPANIKLSNIYGDLLAIGAAISWGLFSNLGKRNKNDIIISNYIYILTAFILSIVSMLLFSSFKIPGVIGLGGGIWLSLSNIVLSYFIWFKILKSSSISFAANLSFITPFITLLFIAVLLKEKISLVQLIGLFVIITGNLMPKMCYNTNINKL